MKGYLRLAMALKGLGQKEEALKVAKLGVEQGAENERIANEGLAEAQREKEEAEKKKDAEQQEGEVAPTPKGKTPSMTPAEAQKLVAGLSDLKGLADSIDYELTKPVTAAGQQKKTAVVDQEVYQEYMTAALGVQQTSQELQAATREMRGYELSLKQLDAMKEGTKTYQAVGRMFLQKDIKVVKDDIQKDIKAINEGVENLTKKMKFYEKKAIDLKNELEGSMTASSASAASS